ncbi:MAG: hypothetical protein HYU36_01725 [Planctomycetes bacterium]|nr:hypothetical protein [Planctomycetota bacterium]
MKRLVMLALLALPLPAFAQDYTYKPDGLGGYRVYDQFYNLVSIIKPRSGGGYNVYDESYSQVGTYRPRSLGGYTFEYNRLYQSFSLPQRQPVFYYCRGCMPYRVFSATAPYGRWAYTCYGHWK